MTLSFLSVRYTDEKLKTKEKYVATLTKKWPVFLWGGNILVEFLAALGEKEDRLPEIHQRMNNLLHSLSVLRKIGPQVKINFLFFILILD